MHRVSVVKLDANAKKRVVAKEVLVPRMTSLALLRAAVHLPKHLGFCEAADHNIVSDESKTPVDSIFRGGGTVLVRKYGPPPSLVDKAYDASNVSVPAQPTLKRKKKVSL